MRRIISRQMRQMSGGVPGAGGRPGPGGKNQKGGGGVGNMFGMVCGVCVCVCVCVCV